MPNRRPSGVVCKCVLDKCVCVCLSTQYWFSCGSSTSAPLWRSRPFRGSRQSFRAVAVGCCPIRWTTSVYWACAFGGASEIPPQWAKVLRVLVAEWLPDCKLNIQLENIIGLWLINLFTSDWVRPVDWKVSLVGVQECDRPTSWPNSSRCRRVAHCIAVPPRPTENGARREWWRAAESTHERGLCPRTEWSCPTLFPWEPNVFLNNSTGNRNTNNSSN